MYTYFGHAAGPSRNGPAPRPGRCPNSARSSFRNYRACEMRDNSATIYLAGEAIGAKRAQADERVQFARDLYVDADAVILAIRSASPTISRQCAWRRTCCFSCTGVNSAPPEGGAGAGALARRVPDDDLLRRIIAGRVGDVAIDGAEFRS